MTQEAWLFINTFAPWFSAFGTFTAVVVSLYLARRDRAIRLRVHAGRRLVLYAGMPKEHGENVISIYVTNTGHRDATVIGIYWKVGLLKKMVFEQTPSKNSSSMPIKLHDGDEARYPLPESEFLREIKIFAKVMPPSRILWWRSHFMRIGVYTSAGKRFESRLEPGLRKFFVEHIKKIKQEQH